MSSRAPVKTRRYLQWGLLGVLAAGAGILLLEARASWVQAKFLTAWAQSMAFAVQPGATADAQFPANGPYDDRLGYTAILSFVERLTAKGFTVEQQAAPSEQMRAFVADGGYAIYREKYQAGLKIIDRGGDPIYAKSFPQWVYPEFKAVPSLMVKTLLFIEDRELLDQNFSRRNPAVSWDRFAMAAVARVPGLADVVPVRGGASTLATQIEKFRHSPGGHTSSADEKIKQMLTASMRTYMDGPDTQVARQRILVTYLNSTPLGSRPGYGEIIGIADGLAAWFGTDFNEANKVLAAEAATPAASERKAQVYKQVLSLLLAQRRPAYYLGADHAALEDLTNRYLGALKTSGVIDAEMLALARATKLTFSKSPPALLPVSFTERKAADLVRTELLRTLRVPGMYSLDRMDLTVQSTIDRQAQRNVVSVLQKMGDRETVKSLGMVGHNLLSAENDPAKVAYSVVLYERGQEHHTVRVHADSLDKPFNLNNGGKLILGSTAKLRTTATYLNIMAELHGKYAGLSQKDLAARAREVTDPLSVWAVSHLQAHRDRSLQAMLDAAMQRTYSASPHETFFTGGGQHRFANFKKEDNAKAPTLETALRQSINLPFIRLMRDVTRYHLAMDREEFNDSDPGRGRDAYLRRFDDREGREYLSRFHGDYSDLTPEQALETLAGRTRAKAHSLTVIFRAVKPDASIAELEEFLRTRVTTPLERKDVAGLYKKYAAENFSLMDRGYIAGVYPLELWMVTFMQTHLKATWADYTTASTEERQDIYNWLFKTNRKHRQDFRIRILKEEEAFNRVLKDWRNQGYPFAHIIPSYATAIGSSGDRPDALAKLMGIIINDGVDVPITNVERVAFASQTPFETELAYAAARGPKRVFAPEVARTLKRTLESVVEGGTAVRLNKTFTAANGTPLEMDGKTGTGDNRFKTFDAAGNVIESRAVDRTSTFAFFLGDRFFGTITAYVPGEDADQYSFTSALALQLLKGIAPTVQNLIDTPKVQDQIAVYAGEPIQEARAIVPPGATKIRIERN